MKTYVFITFSVHGIGGTQIYVRNKLLFLQKKGWKVKVITSEPGNNIMVKELQPYAKDIIPIIAYNPGLVSNEERETTLQKMANIIGDFGENVLIETNFMGATPWGEMIAERLHARHIIILIQENYHINAPKYQKFFAWKYDRRELAVNTQVALDNLLSKYRNNKLNYNPVLPLYCYNVVEECKTPELDKLIISADYHIGSIGRLNKPFVLPMVKKISIFASEHPDKNFQLVLFGGSPNISDINEILNEQLKNFHIAITGAIFPVPLHLLQKMNVFVASAGSARTSYESGGVTISIDANDFEPIGIMGRDTMLTISRESNNVKYSLSKLLSEVLFSPNKISQPLKSSQNIEEVYLKHIEFISNTDKTQLYYDIRKLWPSRLSIFINKIKIIFKNITIFNEKYNINKISKQF